MKKTLIGLGAMFLVAGSIGVAGALTLMDTTLFTQNGTNAVEDFVDHGWGDVNKLDGFFDYVTWDHLYTFDPAADTINSATLTVWLRDDEDDIWWKPLSLELGFGFAESGDWAIGEVDTGSSQYNVGVSTLADGAFRVTVASLGGDFFIDKSELSIDYTPTATAPVPEPATLLLMGTGLAGLIAARRRKSKMA